MTTIRIVFALLVTAAAVAGCAEERPQSTVSRGLVSGVTSNNGGGMAPADFGHVRIP